MRKQIEYANRRNIPFVVIIGSHELEEKMVTLKDMNSGEQTKMVFSDLAAKFR